jgi:SAM-dependent methyltransferase
MNLPQYINDWFINPKLKTIGFSFYAIRKSLLKAVTELKAIIGGQVLDIGCGVMPYKDYLLESNRISKYIGIDIEPTNYHHHLKPDYYWDGKKIPLETNSVDWVIATEFLEHYFNTQAILKEIQRVLKPGGKLFFTVPCIWTLHESPNDEYRFTPYSLNKHFSLAGFKESDIKALGGFNLSLAILIGLWLEKRDLSKRGRIIFKFILTPFYKYLLKKDIIYNNFTNDQYPSGLYGYATK